MDTRKWAADYNSSESTQGMAEYHLTKREKCDPCMNQFGYDGSQPDDHQHGLIRLCYKCKGCGYIETQVDADEWLLSRLADVRYGFGQDDGRECLVDPRWNSNDIPAEM